MTTNTYKTQNIEWEWINRHQEVGWTQKKSYAEDCDLSYKNEELKDESFKL